MLGYLKGLGRRGSKSEADRHSADSAAVGSREIHEAGQRKAGQLEAGLAEMHGGSGDISRTLHRSLSVTGRKLGCDQLPDSDTGKADTNESASEEDEVEDSGKDDAVEDDSSSVVSAITSEATSLSSGTCPAGFICN